MKRRLCQHRLARQKRFVDVLGQRMGPRKIHVSAVGEGDQKARVRNPPHGSNPRLRLSCGLPSTLPAKSRNGWRDFRVRESSSCSRTIRPLGIPVNRDSPSSHRFRSSGNRKVIVLLISGHVRHHARVCKTESHSISRSSRLQRDREICALDPNGAKLSGVEQASRLLFPL